MNKAILEAEKAVPLSSQIRLCVVCEDRLPLNSRKYTCSGKCRIIAWAVREIGKIKRRKNLASNKAALAEANKVFFRSSSTKEKGAK
jgi:hypothetical protein